VANVQTIVWVTVRPYSQGPGEHGRVEAQVAVMLGKRMISVRPS
jgi:hypothetical protein